MTTWRSIGFALLFILGSLAGPGVVVVDKGFAWTDADGPEIGSPMVDRVEATLPIER